MDWLVTIKRGAPAAEIERELLRSGCAAIEAPPIPSGDDEQVVAVTGPKDLPARLQGAPGIVGVHPNSALTLY